MTRRAQDPTLVSHSNPIFANFTQRVDSLKGSNVRRDEVIVEHDWKIREHNQRLPYQDDILA